MLSFRVMLVPKSHIFTHGARRSPSPALHAILISASLYQQRRSTGETAFNHLEVVQCSGLSFACALCAAREMAAVIEKLQAEVAAAKVQVAGLALAEPSGGA